jgi:hypothetical protein
MPWAYRRSGSLWKQISSAVLCLLAVLPMLDEKFVETK